MSAAGRWAARVVIGVLLALYAAISLYPFLWMVSAAFKDQFEVVRGTNLIPHHPTLSTLADWPLSQLMGGTWAQEEGEKRLLAAGFVGGPVAQLVCSETSALDCVDGCPSDPNKLAPGVCGCGAPDVDSDGDGALDCFDGCPNDANKTSPGACGCGVADVDSDSDGVADCLDGCPSDPNKSAPGACGSAPPSAVRCRSTLICPTCWCAAFRMAPNLCGSSPGFGFWTVPSIWMLIEDWNLPHGSHNSIRQPCGSKPCQNQSSR